MTLSPVRESAYNTYLQQSHFGSLDGLRFVAIMAVVIHHSPWQVYFPSHPLILSRGYLGVDLFFVISGYLITTLLLRERDRTGAISLRGFYWRRILRILPLYYLVVTAVGGYFVFVAGEQKAATIWPYYYLFFANFLPSHITTLYPTWSLSVEEQFYLFWPLCMVLLPKRALLPVLLGFVLLNVVAVTGALARFGIVPFSIGPLKFALPNATYAPMLLGAALAVSLHAKSGFDALYKVVGQRWSCLLWGRSW